MRKKRITKLALVSDEYLKSIIILDWGVTYESTLMSCLDGDKQQLTFLIVNPDNTQMLENLKDPKIFYDNWGMLRCSDLNKNYFNLDSTVSYQVMSYQAFLK